MRSKFLALLVGAIALLAMGVGAASADVVGTRYTQIVSPPPGTTNLPADGPSDGLDKVGALIPTAIPYLFDRAAGLLGGPAVLPNDPYVGMTHPADNLEFSQDNRIIHYAAFDSMATNLVPNQTSDGHHHIFLFVRDVNNTSNPLAGTLVQVDPNAGGDSYKPSLDGKTISGNRAMRSHCVVFQSTSRLTKADTSTSSSIYRFDIDSAKFTLISGSLDARDGVIDGNCSNIVFESEGHVWVYLGELHALIKGPSGFNPDIQTDGKGFAYDYDGQVYYMPIQPFSLMTNGDHFTYVPLPPKATLVSNSAEDPSRPANGHSSMPSVNDNGDYVAFESTATDLCAATDGSHQRCHGVSIDRNGTKSDVFRRTLAVDAPTGKTETAKVKVFKPVKVKVRRGTTRIRYKKASGRVGNEVEMIDYDGQEDFQSDLDSDQVKISGAGEQACFRSFGVETRKRKFRDDGQQGPFMHIYFWNAPRERVDGKGLPIARFTGESKAGTTSDTEFFHAPGQAAWNWSCAISNRGNVIGWTSDEITQSGEQNGRLIPDIFLRFMGASDEGLGGIGS